MNPQAIVSAIGQFYATLIIVYVLMSWFPISGIFADLYQVLASIVEPYIGLFRRIVPPLGMIDITPIVALLVLQWVIVPLLARLVGAL
ncbi:MAG TPA: YggT family protein [Coriobacteriia bacterium]|nr:YggT family protein [Coriobacteriia bacterium]